MRQFLDEMEPLDWFLLGVCVASLAGLVYVTVVK